MRLQGPGSPSPVADRSGRCLLRTCQCWLAQLDCDRTAAAVRCAACVMLRPVRADKDCAMCRCSSLQGWKDPAKWLAIVRELQLSPDQQASMLAARQRSLQGLKRCLPIPSCCL